MSDNLEKLFKAARAGQPDTSRVEYGFETRLLARLREKQALQQPWYALAWRLMPVSAVVIILGIWGRSVFEPVSLETAFGDAPSEISLGD